MKSKKFVMSELFSYKLFISVFVTLIPIMDSVMDFSMFFCNIKKSTKQIDTYFECQFSGIFWFKIVECRAAWSRWALLSHGSLSWWPHWWWQWWCWNLDKTCLFITNTIPFRLKKICNFQIKFNTMRIIKR